MSNEGEGHHMDMDETYPRENFEQEEPKHPTPPSSPQLTHDAHELQKTTKTFADVEQPDVETNPTVEQETQQMSILKPEPLTRNIVSQE